MTEVRAQRRLAAILAADVAGYSRMMGMDEEGTLAALTADRAAVVEPAVARHSGRVIKTTGDGFLIEFASAVAAVESALAIQDGMRERNASRAPDRRIEFRIGVNLGDVIVQDDDLFGDGVNVAARLETLAHAGGICASEKVVAEVRGRIAAALEDLGPRSLKNIATPVRVYRVGGPGTATEYDAARASFEGDKPSIAVLPFDNMSGDPEQTFFSDGIAEDVITDLSKISGLLVIARNSSFAYKGRSVNIGEVCRELGVRHVLEGSVRKVGNRVRVTAQLIDGATGGHLWGERYDRDLTDIFAVQDDITRHIVEALAVKLTRGEDRRLAPRAANLEAYQCYLRGRECAWRMTKDASVEARTLIERAIALDPGHAAAHAMLAHVHHLDYLNQWSADPTRSAELAYDLARRAVELDDTEPWAHWVLSLVHALRKEYPEALAEIERSLELDPNFAAGYSGLGMSLLWRGQAVEALEAFAAGARLDPHHPDIMLHMAARAHFLLGEYERASEILEQRIARNPSTDISRVLLASCRGHLGDVEAARAAWAEAFRVNPAYSLEHRRELLPEREYVQMLAGLRKAGLIER